MNDIKNARPRVLAHAARRAREQFDAARFSRFFGPDLTLVPAPRSSPLRQDSLWPALEICQALVKLGLAHDLFTGLQRTHEVRKAASAATPQERPTVDEHLQSLSLPAPPLTPPQRITVVDDVVTQGRMLYASVLTVQQAFPKAEVRAFALLRTMSRGEVVAILDPVAGTIAYDSTKRETLRRP